MNKITVFIFGYSCKEWHWQFWLQEFLIRSDYIYTRRSSAKRGFKRWALRATRELDMVLYDRIEWVDE